MPSLFASAALLPSGWARDVLLEWDSTGKLTRVQADAAANGAPRAQGPVLPGMANVHSHAFQRAMAGLAEFRGHPTDDFWTWREAMYDLVRRVEPEDLESIATHLYIELLKHGYTSVGEFHYLQRDRNGEPYADVAELAERIVSAARASGIALTLLPVMYSFGGFRQRALNGAQRRFASDPRSTGALLETLAQRHGNEALFRLGVAPHSVRAVDAAGLREVVEAARRLDATMPVHMHLSEQTREVAECVDAHGLTPFEWVARVAAVDAHWCFIHATHITPHEAAALADARASVGLCPTTEASLGDGIFEFQHWFERGGRWCIGGDSHVSTSPFDELRALEHSQRLKLRARNIAASERSPQVATNLWSAAAETGAQALAQPAGALAPGRRADLVVLDGADADFENLSAPAALAVATFSGTANRVRDVLIAGKAIVREGRHDGEAQASNRYRATLRRLRAGGP